MIPRIRVAYIAFSLSCFSYLFLLSPLMFLIYTRDDIPILTILYPLAASAAFSIIIALESVFYLYVFSLLVKFFSIGRVCACFLSLVISGAVFSLLLFFITEYWVLVFFLLIVIFFAELINLFFDRKGCRKTERNT